MRDVAKEVGAPTFRQEIRQRLEYCEQVQCLPPSVRLRCKYCRLFKYMAMLITCTLGIPPGCSNGSKRRTLCSLCRVAVGLIIRVAPGNSRHPIRIDSDPYNCPWDVRINLYQVRSDIAQCIVLPSGAEQPLGSAPTPENGGRACVAPCQEHEHGVPAGDVSDGGGERDGRDGGGIPDGLRDALFGAGNGNRNIK